MIRNYIKTAFRSLLNNKGFTAINVFGLAIGLATCLVLLLYVMDELSYDRYNSNSSRIFRVNEDVKLGNNNILYAVCMPPLADALKNDFPEVEDVARLRVAPGFHIKKGSENILEYGTVYADQSLFNVFTLPMIYGNPSTALKEPNSVVVTESIARKYFNRTDVIGQTIKTDNNQLLNITGVITDIPKNSHFNFDFFEAMSALPDSKVNQWLRSDYNTYVLLKKGADPAKFEAKLPGFLKAHSNAEMEADLHLNMDAFEKSGSYFRLNLTPLTDIHLHSNRTGELGANSTVQYVYIFSAIGIFILLIACINFMNLSTARSSSRAREVGVRKVLGSPRKYLIAQFLTESILVTLVSTVIAFIIVLAVLPLFNQVAGKSIEISAYSLTWIIPMLLVIILVVGFLAGAYPAFFLSAFQPVNVLKGKIANGFKSGWLRSIMVVFQFSISIFLIIGTLVIYNQLKYIQTKDVGYNRNQVLVIKNAFELGSRSITFKQEVKQLPGVINATLTSFLPTSQNRSSSIYYKDATYDQKKSVFPQSWSVDNDYINTLDMKLVSGRNFSSQMPTDSSALIINESAAKFLGFNDPLNKTLYKNEDGNRDHIKKFHIIGVVKDFHFNSLRENISPVVLRLSDDMGSLSIRITPANLPGLMSQIQDKWKQLTPMHLEYTFMDQDFDAMYHSEQRIGTIFIVFTSLAILVACLGLFGLAAYAAEQRTKEVGIRKILGASMSTIVGMLSVDFIKLILIAILIACPFAWYLMTKWLQDFAYRQNIQWWVPVVAGGAAVFVAFATISYQSIKAALTNPVKSLRSE